MSQAPTSRPGSTVAQLKNDIDTGVTNDKVASPDPGLSPLGTDDESAGRPASPQVIDMARRQEAAIGVAADAEIAATRTERSWFIPTLITVLLVFVVAAAAYGLMPH